MDHTEASGPAYEGSMGPHESPCRADVTILSIDAELADLHAANAEESEAVALAVLEWLLIETNACFKQHYYSQKSISSAASFLSECVFDGLTGATLAPETEVEAQIFQSETNPVPEPRDRHAVQSLPLRSLEKSACGVDQCSTTSSIQRNGARNRLTTITATKRRRNPDRGTIAVIPKTASVVSLPKVTVVDEKEPDERPDVKAWRQRCLKELSNGGKRESCVTSKWALLSRSRVIEPQISMHVEVIEAASLLGRAEALRSVEMKSSVNTFSAISNPSRHRRGTRASFAKIDSTVPEVFSGPSARNHNSVQLQDSLSRARGSHQANTVAHHGAKSPLSPRNNPWKYDEGQAERFLPDTAVASATAIPGAIALSPGVGLSQGEESLRGPERKDNPQTMSRKRFELHQRLATDYLLQESLYSKSPRGNPAPGSTSPSSHNQQSPRPYKQVPPDPIPPPSLSPVGKGALVVPKTHLAQSYSTPSLRIRSSSALRRDNPHTMTTGKLQTLASLDATRNSRPNTALGVIPGKRSKEALLQYRGHAHKSSSTEYMREFPQPHHGVIKIMKSRERSASNTSVDAAIESARQRLAWIS